MRYLGHEQGITSHITLRDVILYHALGVRLAMRVVATMRGVSVENQQIRMTSNGTLVTLTII
jgi:hypothetical protein